MSAAGTSWPPSAFWEFSLDLYRQPGVEAACLTLQDRHGLDVNLVLLARWLAHTGRRLPPALARRARALGDAHQATVMQPLRQARRALKAQDPGIVLAPLLTDRRRALLELELDFERLEQLQLEQLLAEHVDAAQANPGETGHSAMNDTAEALFFANLARLYPDREVPASISAVLASTLPGARRRGHPTGLPLESQELGHKTSG